MSRSTLDDEQLYNLINSHLCLYYKGDKDYRDIYKKLNVLEFIASSLYVCNICNANKIKAKL